MSVNFFSLLFQNNQKILQLWKILHYGLNSSSTLTSYSLITDHLVPVPNPFLNNTKTGKEISKNNLSYFLAGNIMIWFARRSNHWQNIWVHPQPIWYLFQIQLMVSIWSHDRFDSIPGMKSFPAITNMVPVITHGISTAQSMAHAIFIS